MLARSVSLIDAQFLRAARDGIVDDEHWSLAAFFEWLRPKHHWRFRTYYFDAPPYLPKQNATDGQRENYDSKLGELASINRLERVSVRQGYCKMERRGGKIIAGENRGDYEKIKFVGQKMVDVLLATELTRIAWSREARHIGLVAGDADFRPAVQAAQQAGAIVRLFHIKKPGTGTSAELFDLVDERVDLMPIFDAMQRGEKPPEKIPDYMMAAANVESAEEYIAAEQARS